METSGQAARQIQDALASVQAAQTTINNLVIAHEYQDVALLLVQAGAQLLEAAAHLLDSQDEAAFEAIDSAEDLLDEVYKIIDGETDED